MPDFEGGQLNSRAAAHVDWTHREQRQALFDMHRMQEQRELARRKAELSHFRDQQGQVEHRYDARTRQIEAGKERARQAIERRHDGMAGRLQRMTRAGRARQRDEMERLNDRAAQLHARAYRQYDRSMQRLTHNEQKARIGHAREVKRLREEHWQYREQHTQRHQQTRDNQVRDRARKLAEERLRQAMRQENDRQQGHRRMG